MKTTLYFLSLFFLSATLFGKVVETKSFSAILPEIDQDTLVLVDIDETLLTTPAFLGYSEWWEYYQNKVRTTGGDHKDDIWIEITNAILKSLPVVAVEKEAASIIHSLQMRGITVLGLTARHIEAPWDKERDKKENLNFSHKTKSDLHAIGVDFCKSPIPPSMKLHPKQRGKNHAFNIIFTCWKKKGPVLMEFFKTVGFRPKKVVMIDDQYPQLISLDLAHKKAGIPFMGFHYTLHSHQKPAFDPLVANIQLKELLINSRFLSHEEAVQAKSAILEENPAISPHFYLEELVENLRNKLSLRP